MNVQGDEPFIGADAVSGALSQVTSGNFPLGTAACHAAPEILANPDVVKVVIDSNGRALYFSRAPIPFLRDAADRASVIASFISISACTPTRATR